MTWRLGFASNDQYTFANTLLAVAEGRLYLTEAVYGPASGATPGTHLVDGRVYGRNYGIVVVSAVWYTGLRALNLVADVRVLLTGLWSVGVIWLTATVGTHFDRRRTGVVTGTALGLALFLGSLLVVEPLSSYWLPQIALQLTTALATAVAAVVCYRLVARLYGRRVGLAAGIALVAATPVGFWATLPKRHSVTAMLVVCTAYTLYRSREAATEQTATRFRALTYVWPALLAWVHAPLGFILLVAIGVVDLPTARSNDPRALATVAVAFGVSLLPFLLTNVAISGNPIHPPRFLGGYDGDVLTPDTAANETTGAPSSQSSPGGGLLPTPVTTIISRFVGSYAVLLDPGRLFTVFVRAGYVPSFSPSQDAAINLSVLTSMPLLGGLLAYPLLGVRRAFASREIVRSPRQWSPVRVVDAFSVVYAILLVGLYLESLPIHHMLTVRYLHPMYPLGLYWLVRLPAVRHVVTGESQTLAHAYGGTVLLGVPAYVGAIAVGELVLGESVQLYALTALSVAAIVGGWAVADTYRKRGGRVGAVALGVAAGLTSVYLLVAGLSLFPTTGEFLLPLSGAISDQIHYARLLGSSPPY